MNDTLNFIDVKCSQVWVIEGEGIRTMRYISTLTTLIAFSFQK